MSRSISEIYRQAVEERDKRLELKEFNNDSKMSIMNAITWVSSALIHSFEVILDAFAVDVSEVMNRRINGTPAYYASVLSQYQSGDELMMRSDGLAFGYPSVDETKQIISQVSYVEQWDKNKTEYKLILKVAQEKDGGLAPLDMEELVSVNSYIRNFTFAGTNVSVVSHNGDILVPKLTVYYDGSVPSSMMYDRLHESLTNYVKNIPFDSSVYVLNVIDALRSVPNVTDVYANEDDEQGVFLAKYDTDGKLGKLEKVNRVGFTSSGFMRESSGKGDESEIPSFKESIKLVVGK